MAQNSISAKAAAADKFVSEYAAQVKVFEEEMGTQIDNMYSVLNGLFGSWIGDLADKYHAKIDNNLQELIVACERGNKLSKVLEKRAEQMRAMLEKLNKAGDAN